MNVKVIIMNDKAKFEQLLEKLESIEAKLDENKEVLKRKDLLDNADMCALLGITKRTLQRYRQKGVLPYYMMEGKPYYKAEEVQERLKRILKDRNNQNPKKHGSNSN